MISAPLLLLLATAGYTTPSLNNGGFESEPVTANWVVSGAHAAIVIKADTQSPKQGRQALLVSAAEPTDISLSQEIYLPVGTLWRLSAWLKVGPNTAGAGSPAIVVDTPSGRQGTATTARNDPDWQLVAILFRA